MKNRRHDFNIKPVTSAIDRIERELYGGEDWIEEELKSVFPFEYNNGNIPHTNSTPLNSEKEFLYMKATGIVRRIDDLGRVVIPKEIRRTMRIREGDPLEIYTASNGEVIFKKYSPIGELSEFAGQYTDVLHRATNLPVIITDRDHVIAASGNTRKDMIDKRISTDLEDLIERRENYIASPDVKALYPLNDNHSEAGIAFPIIGGGDVAGAVVLLLNPDGSMPSQTEIKLLSVAASFLGKQTEE